MASDGFDAEAGEANAATVGRGAAGPRFAAPPPVGAARGGTSAVARLAFLAAPIASGIAKIEAVSARFLRDDEQFLYASRHQPLGLAHHLADGAAGKLPAQMRDDAEAASVVASLRDLQIGVVARREPDALRR